ncbi:NADH:flavorubredoxin reductase NorW [Vibrio sp. SCSIO 43140]|uniref:NADH:flavorubredoxin reductase NorW n=1 Tax=Vibrio sp. SCSIO 43140 TaxID=2819100 RepID=UPI00207551A8|nr:NADH:flavorubredoxin reductase NorW [Vibrio sp. SCSIO 43140]USD63379.1 NADH:flavorubredoxin reductase NorW [Vibrio sp. SCSIO 43140]
MKLFDIVIIGSGFAAYQLIKSVRRLDQDKTIAVITQDEGHEYNKPDLSHVFSKRQTASDLVVKTASEFASEFNVTLFAQSKVEDIEVYDRVVKTAVEKIQYHKLVLATGASPFIPPFTGNAETDVITHNSLYEYQQRQTRWNDAQSVLVIGGGLIGVELAMDLADSGKEVTLVEPANRLMTAQLPEFLEAKLRNAMEAKSINIYTGLCMDEVSHRSTEKLVKLSNGETLKVDEVTVCAGLRPNVQLATKAQLSVNRGIIVDEYLATSQPDIYALGDCAEIYGMVRAYLQPIVVSATALAKTLTSSPTKVLLPNMLTKVKTPAYPIQLSGVLTGEDVTRWSYDVSRSGIVAKSYNADDKLIGFVATEQRIQESFPLLREL